MPAGTRPNGEPTFTLQLFSGDPAHTLKLNKKIFIQGKPIHFCRDKGAPLENYS